jgi:ComF family protein
MMSAALGRLANALLDLIYPPHCVACGAMGAWLCSRCLATAPRLDPPLCAHCGRPLGSEPGGTLCIHCSQESSALDCIRSWGPHAPPLREAVHALKYEGLRALADPLAALLAECYLAQGLVADVLAPVPLHPARVRQRGYNQSLLLAAALSRRLALPLWQGLTRERNTRSQVGLSREARRENVAGAFRCATDGLPGQRVLLIDDVLTTGATLESCAVALRAAGARSVSALTLTRALGWPTTDAQDV